MVLFDVDGTLLVLRAGVKKIPYGDAEGLLRDQVPNSAAVVLALALEDAGFEVRFTTGRSEDLRGVTIEQLEAVGFKGVDDRLDCHGYTSYRQLVQDKADYAADFAAVLIVGDQDIEMEAAAAAGAGFLHVDDITGLESLDYAFCWICGCTQLRACTPPCGWANARLCTACAAAPNQRLDLDELVEVSCNPTQGSKIAPSEGSGREDLAVDVVAGVPPEVDGAP